MVNVNVPISIIRLMRKIRKIAKYFLEKLTIDALDSKEDQ